MFYLRGLTFLVMFFFLPQISIASDEAKDALRVYGPGGPFRAISECAEIFSQRSGVPVQVIKALPYKIQKRLPEDGDIYYAGAEYMLEEFNQRNPGVLNMSTIEKLLPRQIGIIVRKGNPMNIRGIEDLAHKEVELLDVKLENMRHFYGNHNDPLSNVRRLEYTGLQGVSAWLSDPHLDAWVTYKTWHSFLSDDSEFITIDREDAVRHIPVAMAKKTEKHKDAGHFISFLQSKEAQQVFIDHGWN